MMPKRTHHDEAARDESKAPVRDTRADTDTATDEAEQDSPREIGGRDGPDPTRYGDWEKGGRCIDF